MQVRQHVGVGEHLGNKKEILGSPGQQAEMNRHSKNTS